MGASGSKSNGRFTGRPGKGMGAAPTLAGVAWPKALVDLQGQPPGDGGTGLHGGRDGGGDVSQRQHEAVQPSSVH
jgi:hypothetical protein